MIMNQSLSGIRFQSDVQNFEISQNEILLHMIVNGQQNGRSILKNMVLESNTWAAIYSEVHT